MLTNILEGDAEPAKARLRVLLHAARHADAAGLRQCLQLDAFNDILRGGFGTPEGGFVLRWKNSAVSRERLGYPETVRQLERRLARCHPGNRTWVGKDLEQARQGVGPTVFDWLTEIIQELCAGGQEQEDGVEVKLE